MGSKKKSQNTTVTKSEPWSGAKGNLKLVQGEARDLYDRGVGSGVYEGNRVVPFSNQTLQGLGGMQRVAMEGASGNSPLSAMRGGFDQLFSSARSGAGTNRFLQPYAEQGMQGAGRPILEGFAQRGVGAYGAPQLASFAAGGPLSQSEMGAGRFTDLDRGNPYLDRALAAAGQKTADQVNRQFSAAGRYGSGAHTAALANEIGDLQQTARLQQFNTDADRALGAMGQIDQMRFQRDANAMNAIGMGQDQLQQNMAAQMGAIDRMQAQNQDSLAAQMGAIDRLEGNQDRQFGQLMNAVQIAPGVYDAQMSPYRTLAQIGDVYEGKDAEKVAARMDRFYERQNKPWELLGRLNSFATGTGGGTTSQTAPSRSPLLGALGGGISGMQLAQGLGASGGMGALLGGLGGLFL